MKLGDKVKLQKIRDDCDARAGSITSAVAYFPVKGQFINFLINVIQ